jgi:NACalpha-BTF3-like transcription factor
MGQKSWQIIGKEREEESFQKGSEKHEYIPSEEDIKIIMQKTGKSRAEARKALEKTKDLAEAILLLGK